MNLQDVVNRYATKNCPICGNQVERFNLVGGDVGRCANKCFNYEINYYGLNKEIVFRFSVEVFGENYHMLSYNQSPAALYQLADDINYWKENDRYLAEILINET